MLFTCRSAISIAIHARNMSSFYKRLGCSRAAHSASLPRHQSSEIDAVSGVQGRARHVQSASPGARYMARIGTSGSPARFPVRPGCHLRVGGALVSIGFTSDGAGAATLPAPVPNSTKLVGLSFYLHAAILRQGGPALGVADLSGALQLVIGR